MSQIAAVHEQTFPDPVTEVLQTIQESVRSVKTTGLLRFADILVQPPASITHIADWSPV
jgi:hypothetical protein